jgi:hypothetical protein
VDIVLMDLGNPRLFEADASHDSIKALRHLSKSRARRNVHTLPFSLDKSGRNGEFGKGFLLTFVPRALLRASCLSPKPWSLQNRGHCKTVVTAKSWSLQNRGHCKIVVTAKSWSLQNGGHCKMVVTAKSWSQQSRDRLRNASYPVSRLGAYIGASRPCSKDSVHHRVDDASMGLIAKVY